MLPAESRGPAVGRGRIIAPEDTGTAATGGETSDGEGAPAGEPATDADAPRRGPAFTVDSSADVEVGTPRIIRPDVPATDDKDDLHDRSLSYYPDDVNLAGQRRDFTRDNRFDVGGNFYSNEGGQSIWGAIRFAHRSGVIRPFNAEFDAGNMWFGRLQAPYARLFMRPELHVWRLKGTYYGSVGAVGNLPSWLYTSHALGIGYSQPIGKDFRLRMGFIGGGGLSYPAFDDIYFRMAGGLSTEYKGFMVYGMVDSFFAAPDPIKTAYVGYYRPRFQDVEFGAQYRFMEDQYTVRIFGNYGRIDQRAAVRVTRSMGLTPEMAGDFWIGGGATHWAPELGGRWDPAVFAGMTLVFGGKHFNSTNTAEFEHYTLGGVESVQTDIPTNENPGPYGFGRSGNPEVDAQVNLAKERIAGSSNFQEFAASYQNASVNEKIMAARFLGAFLQQVAYASGTMEALYNTRFFDPEVQRIAGASSDTVFSYMQQYVDFYNTHPASTPLPEHLANGIAVCAGIANQQAEFLRANGIPAMAMSVNTPGGPHVVTTASPPGATALLDYGNLYTAPERSFDEVLRYYGQMKQAPTFQSQLFDQNGYFGTYETAEGRLLHRNVGIMYLRTLGTDFLGVR